MSKTLHDLSAKHPDKIADWYRDSDGYWITLKQGWMNDGSHTVHELTVREAVASFRDVVPWNSEMYGEETY